MDGTRRAVLGGSLVLSAAMLAQSQAAAQESGGGSHRPVATGPVGHGESLALARHVADTRFEDLSPAVVEATKRSIMDAIGVSLGASGLEPACRPFIETALEMGAGLPQSRVIGQGGKRVQVGYAALANGAMAHCLDYEDIHDATGMHPNGATVPAALAVAESLGGVSGKDLITAVAVGCDMAVRLALAGRAYGFTSTDFSFYPPAIVGAFGATAAAAKLLKLNQAQVMSAFSLVLCQTACSSELIYSPDGDIRAIRDGFGAQAGVLSAFLARRGVTGFEKPFEGESGFYNMYGDGRFDSALLVDDLGRKFHGEDIRYKAWPACAGNHIYIQAALEMIQGAPLDPARIARITVPTGSTMLVEPAASKRAPRTAIDAKFSMPFCIATAFIQKDVTLASFSDQARQNRAVLDVAAKFGYRIDDKAARLTSQGGGDILEVETRDGQVRRQKVDAIYGSLKKPLSEQALLSKFDDCAAHAPKPISAARRTALAQNLLNLQTLPDLKPVLSEI